jgi:hypothetical protein
LELEMCVLLYFSENCFQLRGGLGCSFSVV